MKTERRLGIGLIAVLALAILVYWRSRQTVFAESSYPEADIRIEVREKRPPFLKDCPYQYTLTLERLSTGQPLAGQPMSLSNDSSRLNDLSFAWAKNHVVTGEKIGVRRLDRLIRKRSTGVVDPHGSIRTH